jgi:hypothetical protein
VGVNTRVVSAKRPLVSPGSTVTHG